MSSQPTPANQLKSPKWQVYFLRFTAFLSPSAVFDASTWWKDVVGELPDSQQRNPKLFEQTEIYSYKGGNLILEVQPGRIDWKFSHLSVDQPFPHSADELQNEGNLSADFMTIVDRWLGIAPPIIRMAFGPHFAIPVGSRNEGYQHLSVYLPSVSLDIGHISDFIYQINRPRISSQIPDLRINRLTKWATVIVTSTALPLISGVLPSQMPTNQFHMAHLELDVNTDAKHTEAFSSDRVKPMFAELKDLALEIVSKGDVP